MGGRCVALREVIGMSVVIDRTQDFLGVPLVTVRNVLHAWRYGGSREPHDIAQRSNVKLSPSTVMVLLHELRERGLIGLEKAETRSGTIDGLTHAGLALVAAVARKRTPKSKAREVLEKFLAACSAANAREDFPITIKEIWLFGSMIAAQKTEVADIDLVMVTEYRAKFDDRRKQLKQLAEAIGGENVCSNLRYDLFWSEKYVLNQVLHGGRRHPLLSFARLNDLIALACPCQLIFDATRGGKVEDPVLERHPSSTGRADTVLDKLELPNLSGARRPFRPISALLAEPIVQEWGWWTGVVAAPPIVGDIKRNAMLTRINLDGCNGQERVCAISCDGRRSDGYRPKAALIFDREICDREDTIKMCVRFQRSAHLGLRPDYLHAQALNKWIASLVAADLECIIRREKEVGGDRCVDLSFHDAAQTWLTSFATESLSKGIDQFTGMSKLTSCVADDTPIATHASQ